MATTYKQLTSQDRGAASQPRKMKITKHGVDYERTFDTVEEYRDFRDRALNTLALYERDEIEAEYQVYEEDIEPVKEAPAP